VNERVCSTILGNPHDADYMDMLVDWANQAESKKGLTNTGRGKMAKKTERSRALDPQGTAVNKESIYRQGKRAVEDYDN